jgi:hypothetical protein
MSFGLEEFNYCFCKKNELYVNCIECRFDGDLYYKEKRRREEKQEKWNKHCEKFNICARNFNVETFKLSSGWDEFYRIVENQTIFKIIPSKEVEDLYKKRGIYYIIDNNYLSDIHIIKKIKKQDNEYQVNCSLVFPTIGGYSNCTLFLRCNITDNNFVNFGVIEFIGLSAKKEDVYKHLIERLFFEQDYSEPGLAWTIMDYMY